MKRVPGHCFECKYLYPNKDSDKLDVDEGLRKLWRYFYKAFQNPIVGVNYFEGNAIGLMRCLTGGSTRGWNLALSIRVFFALGWKLHVHKSGIYVATQSSQTVHWIYGWWKKLLRPTWRDTTQFIDLAATLLRLRFNNLYGGELVEVARWLQHPARFSTVSNHPTRES